MWQTWTSEDRAFPLARPNPGADTTKIAASPATASLKLFRLVPRAAPHDRNWGRAANQGEIIVRARSSGKARAPAARAEARAMGAPTLSTTQLFASAFDELAPYVLRMVADPALAPAGEPGVLISDLRFPRGFIAHDD